MIIFGVDPGTAVTGYAVIETDGRRHRPLDFGCIRPPRGQPAHARYLALFEGLDRLLGAHRPDALAVETQFVSKNPRSALTLGMARGMAILAAARRRIAIHEYAPSQAKRAVVGNGSASKAQVQQMVQRLLSLPHPPAPEDAADALAVALCHAHRQEIF
jgi:crossover junction endodeoxyribonuclease RuvC